MKGALLLVLLAFPSTARQADAGVPDDLQKELEKAIQADQGAAEKNAPKGGPAPAPAVARSTSSAPRTLSRGAQSLNPDISAILDADSGYVRRAPQFLNGDDPDLRPEGTRHALGFIAREMELALSAIVASLTFQASEFARVRGYLEAEHAGSSPPALLPRALPAWAPAACQQLEISIGAHGAHPF